MSRRTPSRTSRGRLAAADFVVSFGCGGISFFFRFFSFEHTWPAASMRLPCLLYLSTSNEARARGRSDRGRFLPKAKKPLHNEVKRPRPFFVYRQKTLFMPGCVQGAIIQLLGSPSVCLPVCLSVCLSVCLCVLSVCVCVTLVVFADCESYTRPFFTNPGSTEACEYGLARGTRFVARHLEMVTVAGLLRISW